MKLEEAEQIVSELKQRLVPSSIGYWGDIYIQTQDNNLPPHEREYEIYIEYIGEFNFEEFKTLMEFLPKKTLTIAFPTRQIICW